VLLDMAEGVAVVEDVEMTSEVSQMPADDVCSSSLPILVIVVGEPLTETHKDTVVTRIATGKFACAMPLASVSVSVIIRP